MTPESSTWTLARITATLRRLWAVIIGAALLGAGGAYVHGLHVTPTFEATSTLAFSVSQGSTAADLANGGTYAQNQMLTFAQLATSSAVLQPVIDSQNLPSSVANLKRSITVTIPQNTLILKIRVAAPSGPEAADIANAVARNLKTVVRAVTPKPTTGASPNIDASLVDTAVAPRFQTSPNKTKDAAMGGAAGLVLGTFLAMVSALADNRVRNEDDIARLTSLPILGSVPRAHPGRKPLIDQDPITPSTQSFRQIHTTLAHLTRNLPSHRILITSASPGEGKSMVADNLATTLATLGTGVLLVDADLRTHGRRRHNTSAPEGLSAVLDGHLSVATARRTTPPSGPDVLTSGTTTEDPGVLMASAAMRDLLQEAAASWDHVIIDSPSVLEVADACLLAPLVDAVVLVVDCPHTRRAMLRRALAAVEGAGGNVVGIVTNAGPSRRRHRRRPARKREGP